MKNRVFFFELNHRPLNKMQNEICKLNLYHLYDYFYRVQGQPSPKKTIYQFKVTNLEGEEFDFSTLKGKKVMIVNTASKCGLTPQYKKLQALYVKYGNKDFEIIGFPANNFLFQEPGSDEEIAAFCEQNYGVTFPMMSKISVKGGNMHPVYKFLTQRS